MPRFLFCIVVLISIVLLVGSMDYEDFKKSLEAYCESVSANEYPDYKEIYDKECKLKVDKVLK